MDDQKSSVSKVVSEEEECFYCLVSGYHFIGSIDEEGEEIIEAYACRRCSS